MPVIISAFQENLVAKDANLIDGKYAFCDLVDIPRLHAMLEAFSVATGFTTELILFPDQELISSTGWRDICTKFHRVCPASANFCHKSNVELTSALKDQLQMHWRRCDNWLCDGATPIIVDGVHLANLVSGQILLGEPDYNHFRKQAEVFGYDVEAYLLALSKVPVVSEERFKSVLDFLGKLAVMLAEQGLAELRIKRLSQQLQQSEEKYRSLVESSTDWIWEVNSDWIYTYVGPQVQNILGYRPDEVVGKTPFELMPPEEIARVTAIIQKCLEEKRMALTLENINLHRDGRKVILETTGIAVQDASGRIVGYRGVDRDITARKQAEDEMRRMRNLESIGMIAGGIAHDFNNILTGIFGNIQLAKLNLTDENKVGAALDTSLMALESAKSLTRQLLTFSKGGAPVLESVSIRELVRDVVKFNLSGSNVKEDFDLPDGLWLAKADKGQLANVIANLTINAREAMLDGGTLHVSAGNVAEVPETLQGRLSGNFICFSFRDEGSGMTPEIVQKVFDPYFTTKPYGKGLGLSVVHSIVTRHGGLVKVESLPGKGSNFIFFLPAELPEKNGVADKPVEPQRPEVDSCSRAHVLLMDDEFLIREVTRKMLEVFGYEVDDASDGNEAIEKYLASRQNGRPFDVVIMDLTVRAGMGGLEATTKILAADPAARIIVSSGYSTDAVVADYSRHGFAGCLSKPFQIDDLKNELKRVLALAARPKN